MLILFALLCIWMLMIHSWYEFVLGLITTIYTIYLVGNIILMKIRFDDYGITTYSGFAYVIKKWRWNEIIEIGIRVKKEKVKGSFGETSIAKYLYISQRELNDIERMKINKDMAYGIFNGKKHMMVVPYSDEIVEVIMQFWNKPIIETKDCMEIVTY